MRQQRLARYPVQQRGQTYHLTSLLIKCVLLQNSTRRKNILS